MKLSQFTIHNSQFSMNYQLPITNVASDWKMVNGKYLVNDKCLPSAAIAKKRLMVNEATRRSVRVER